MFECSAVITIKIKHTKNEVADKTSINAWAMPPFTSSEYSVAANANTVKGNEYAHHAMLNFLIDFWNNVGLETCYYIWSIYTPRENNIYIYIIIRIYIYLAASSYILWIFIFLWPLKFRSGPLYSVFYLFIYLFFIKKK